MGAGGNDDDRRRRKRRTAGEIYRHHTCVVQSCQKSYGSEGSLNQHLRLKHPEVYEAMPQIHSRCSEEGEAGEESEESGGEAEAEGQREGEGGAEEDVSEEDLVSDSIQLPRKRRY